MLKRFIALIAFMSLILLTQSLASNLKCYPAIGNVIVCSSLSKPWGLFMNIGDELVEIKKRKHSLLIFTGRYSTDMIMVVITELKDASQIRNFQGREDISKRFSREKKLKCRNFKRARESFTGITWDLKYSDSCYIETGGRKVNVSFVAYSGLFRTNTGKIYGVAIGGIAKSLRSRGLMRLMKTFRFFQLPSTSTKS